MFVLKYLFFMLLFLKMSKQENENYASTPVTEYSSGGGGGNSSYNSEMMTITQKSIDKKLSSSTLLPPPQLPPQSSLPSMDDLILSRPGNLVKPSAPPSSTRILLTENETKSEFHHKHHEKQKHKKDHHNLSDKNDNNNADDDDDADVDGEEEDDGDEGYYDKSESEDSEYQEEGDYDDNTDLDLAFNTFGKKILGGENTDNALPIFLEEPQSTFVMRSKTASLSCRAAHALELSFKCSGNVQPIITNHDSHVDPQTGIQFLEITTEISKNLVEEYFGKGPFQCECHAISARGNIKSQPAVIEIAYIKKQFSEYPIPIRVEIGSRSEINCSPPMAMPTPNVTWTKNGITLVSSQSVIILDDHSLLFPHITIQDMGNYSCIAENIAGRRITEPIFVSVYADGGWSQWGLWIDCKCYGQKSNGQKRSRTCTNPSPLNGGSPCSGPAVQKTPECTICQNGRWSNWSEWTTCGYDCLQTRRRSCLNQDTLYQSYDDISERVICIGRDFQSTECRGGTCHLDRDDTDWPLYAGLAIIIVVCIAFGGIISYGANKRRQLSPYTMTRTEIINQNNLSGKQIGYDVVPARTVVTASNYSYPFSRNTANKYGFPYVERPLSEHLYDEPHIRANYTYPSPSPLPPPNDKVSINDSMTSSHYSRSFYSSESYGTSHNTDNNTLFAEHLVMSRKWYPNHSNLNCSINDRLDEE